MQNLQLLLDNEIINGASYVETPATPSFSANDALKRAFDIVCSILGMIIFSPLILGLFVAIHLIERERAIFKQERIGYRGKPFTLYKFRSMKCDSETDGTPQLCKEQDDRFTKIGRFMRDHHLDELPQLYNVLKGDMSFVGPRPERQYFIDQITSINPKYIFLYRLRPGLFSHATLYNGYTDTMEKMLVRLNMDLEYLKNHNLWIDIKIIFLTGVSIFSGKKF